MGAPRPRPAARPRPGYTLRFQLAAPPEPGFTHWHRRAELNRTAVTPARGRYYDSLFSLRSEWRPLSRQNRRHGGTGKFFRQGPQKRCAPLPRAVWRASVFLFHADSLVCLQQFVGSFKVPTKYVQVQESFRSSLGRSASNPIKRGPYMKSPINLRNCPRVVCEHFPSFLGPNTHRNGFFMAVSGR